MVIIFMIMYPIKDTKISHYQLFNKSFFHLIVYQISLISFPILIIKYFSWKVYCSCKQIILYFFSFLSYYLSLINNSKILLIILIYQLFNYPSVKRRNCFYYNNMIFVLDYLYFNLINSNKKFDYDQFVLLYLERLCSLNLVRIRMIIQLDNITFFFVSYYLL